VWIQHRRLEEALRRQTDDLRRELGTRLRLSAVVSHDIRNPLTALLGTAEIAKARGALTAEDLEAIESMARRISQIIDSARNIDAQAGPAAALSVTDVASIHAELSDMLGQRLAEKGQSLVLTSGAELAVYTNPKLLCNSVLSNLVVNASKFSPRDARLELSATTEGDGVRIQLCDRGPGFPDEILQDASASVANPSRPGTEGETGTGYGLHIAALFARVLGGQLEIRNRVQGGAAVAVVLPRKA
jgi:signal transduction histidine kinase